MDAEEDSGRGEVAAIPPLRDGGKRWYLGWRAKRAMPNLIIEIGETQGRPLRPHSGRPEGATRPKGGAQTKRKRLVVRRRTSQRKAGPRAQVGLCAISAAGNGARLSGQPLQKLGTDQKKRETATIARKSLTFAKSVRGGEPSSSRAGASCEGGGSDATVGELLRTAGRGRRSVDCTQRGGRTKRGAWSGRN